MRYTAIPIVLILSLLFVSNCFGEESSLRYKLGYEARNGDAYVPLGVVCLEEANIGFNGEHMWPSLPSSGVLFAVRKASGVNDWNGDTGWYAGDIREPLSPGQSIAVDGIYLWAVSGTPSQDLHVRLIDRPFLDLNVSFSLSLTSIPQGVEYTGPTTWGPETSEIILPFYSTDNGETGYKFRLTVSASQ